MGSLCVDGTKHFRKCGLLASHDVIYKTVYDKFSRRSLPKLHANEKYIKISTTKYMAYLFVAVFLN